MSWLKRVYSNEDIAGQIKDKIRSDPFFIAIFKRFGIPMERLDSHLTITIKRLDRSFGKTNDEQLIIDDRLARSPHFLHGDFHIIAHEILHWLRRQREQMHYFADPEEVEGFTVGIAYALQRVRSHRDWQNLLAKEFLPLIQINIPDDNKAREFLMKRIEEAQHLLSQIGQ